jgi:hypothetical protein
MAIHGKGARIVGSVANAERNAIRLAAEADLNYSPSVVPRPECLQIFRRFRRRTAVRRATGSRLPLPRDSGACSAASSTGPHSRRVPGLTAPAPFHRRVRAERVPQDVHALLRTGDALGAANRLDHAIARNGGSTR